MEPNIHDKFFKSAMTDRENAIDFLKNFLPGNLLKEIDLHSLETKKDSFIDDNLKESFSDVLYSVNIRGKKSYIYTLFEHKSNPDKYTALQLLKYMICIWEKHRSENGDKGKLPIVLPIVVYHGEESWSYGNELSFILEESEVFSRYQPNFVYNLYDLSEYSDTELKGRLELWLMLYLLKNIKSDDLEDKLTYLFDVLNQIIDEQKALKCIQIAIRYIVSATEKITVDKLEKIIENIKLNGGTSNMPTIAETWVQQGYERGLAEQQIIIDRIEAEKRRAEERERRAEEREQRAEVEKRRAEVEKRRAEVEKRRAEVEKRRAEERERRAEERERRAEENAKHKAKIADRKKALRTAINMKRKGSGIDFISEVTELDKKYLERFFLKSGV